MIFGALGGWVVAGIAAAVAAAVTAIFFMKVRHPRVLVPSLLLWRRVLDEDRAVSFWERIRKAVSFAIALLVPLLIVFALGRPERHAGGMAGGPLTIVIDSSLSMLAERTDGRTRWDAATGRAIALSGGDADVTVLTTADGIVAGPTSDREALRVALRNVKPSQPGPFPQALEQSQVVFLTDGVTSYDVPQGVRVESVFSSASNYAITAFDVRRDWRADGRYEAYVELANYSADAKQLTLAIDVGGSRLFERAIEMNADEVVRHSLPFNAGEGGVLRAAIVKAGDAVPQDDEAFAWVASARPSVVTLVTRRNPPLETLLSYDGSVQVERIEPEQWGTGSGGRDASARRGILVFDRWAPQTPPSQPALFIAPPPVPWLSPSGTPERAAVWARADETHAAVRGVDGRTLRFDEVTGYDLKDWTPLAFTARGNPLVAVRETNGVGAALLTFDLTRGTIANDPAFPVLIGDVLEWFARSAPVRVEQPGTIRLPGDVSAIRRVDGGNVAMRRVADVTVADLREPGVYLAERPAGQLAIAVNAGSRLSSNVRQSSRAQDAAAGAPAASAGLWIWLVGIALVLFAAEFYTWHRRITV
ncbi:MAG: BatA and WFA domain-containing protein [Acidobacteriota bacterium]|nr:BatA and WFA domain-containing protein [Acidobacteriota bacterium]